jgi:hypothetical protein
MKKTCVLCQEDKLLSEYDRDSSIKSGYRARCKLCRSNIEAARKSAKKSGTDVRSATSAVIERRKRSVQDRERDLYSEANRNAIRRLIEAHELEFHRFVHEERMALGVKPKWVQLTG